MAPDMPNAVLDAEGLNCPPSILRANKAIRDLHAGDGLKIHTTNPGSVKDFAACCRSPGNERVSSSPEGNLLKFPINRTK